MKRNILLIIFGLLISLVLGEVLLRVAGLIISKPNIPVIQRQDNTFIILCIGDSSTYGVGATDIKKFSYPSQLQELLATKFPDLKYEVINLGVPGINSSQVLNRFEGNIQLYKPNVVIVQVGVNDWWNLEESNVLKHYDQGYMKKIFMSTSLFLNRMKLYQFFKLVLASSEYEDSREGHEASLAVKGEPNIAHYNNETKNKGFWFSYRDPVKTVALYHALKENISGLARIAKKNRVTIIFMKYHIGGKWHMPSTHLSNIYDELSVPTIDNKSLFEVGKSRHLDMFGPDKWHPGNVGYSLISKYIYNKFIELSIIKGEKIKIFD